MQTKKTDMFADYHMKSQTLNSGWLRGFLLLPFCRDKNDLIKWRKVSPGKVPVAVEGGVGVTVLNIFIVV